MLMLMGGDSKQHCFTKRLMLDLATLSQLYVACRDLEHGARTGEQVGILGRGHAGQGQRYVGAAATPVPGRSTVAQQANTSPVRPVQSIFAAQGPSNKLLHLQKTPVF